MRFNEEQIKCAIEVILGKIEPHMDWWLTVTLELVRCYQFEVISKLGNLRFNKDANVKHISMLILGKNNSDLETIARPSVSAFPFPDFIYELMSYLDARSILNLRAVSRSINAAVLYYVQTMVRIFHQTGAKYDYVFSAGYHGSDWILSVTHRDGYSDIVLCNAGLFAIKNTMREFLLQVYMGRPKISVKIKDNSGAYAEYGEIAPGRFEFEWVCIRDSGVDTCSPFCMPDGNVKIRDASEIYYHDQRVLFVPIDKRKDATTRVRAISCSNEYDLDICYKRYSDINIGKLFAEILSIANF